jgi:hypothetical protein
MIKETYIKHLSHEESIVAISDRYVFIDKAKRGLQHIDKKTIDYPNWKATCPKTDMPLTLPDIKEELQAYLEDAEDEVNQLNLHIEKLVAPVKAKTKVVACKQLRMF